ncbi:MAG: hypothetical protein ACE3JK_03640 [Sporolactobacillus sp.]
MTLLDKFQESDFAMFKKGLISGRLNPSRVGKFLLVVDLISALFIYCGQQAAIVAHGSFYKSWISLIYGQWYSLLALAIVSLPFLLKKVSVTFQKSGLVLLILSFIELAIDLSCATLFAWKYSYANLPFNLVILLYMIINLLIFVLSLIRSYFLLKKGEFRKEGRGFFHKQYSEGMSRFSAILPFSAAGVLLSIIASKYWGQDASTVLIVIVGFVVSLFLFGVGIIEYLYIIYCKFRFKSFNAVREEESFDLSDL